MYHFWIFQDFIRKNLSFIDLVGTKIYTSTNSIRLICWVHIGVDEEKVHIWMWKNTACSTRVRTSMAQSMNAEKRNGLLKDLGAGFGF